MTKKRKPDALPEAEAVASASECTGLMPALPEDETGEENTSELYAIHSPKGARNAPRPAR